MTRIAVLVVVMSVGAVPSPTAQTADITKQLHQRYSDWMKAFWRGDGATMDRMEADGLVLVFPEGTIWSKQQPRAVELKGRSPMPYTHTLEQVTARTHGDVAVLTGIQHDVNTKDGSKIRSAFTSVWKRDGGDWKVWSAHWSEQPQGKK